MRTLTELRQDMDKALKAEIVPILRELGFIGSYPNFRRNHNGRLDLFSFGFNKYGGSVAIVTGQCATGEFTASGKIVPESKVTIAHLACNMREQFGIEGPDGLENFSFKYGRIADCVGQIRVRFDDAIAWFEMGRDSLR